MIPIPTSVGDRIEFVRNDHKLTQQDFCDQVGISRGAYQHYVKGARHVPSCVLEKIVLKFGTEARWLLTGFVPLLSGENEQLVRDTMMLRTLIDRCCLEDGHALNEDQKIRIVQNMIIIRSKESDDSVYDRERLKAFVRREAESSDNS